MLSQECDYLLLSLRYAICLVLLSQQRKGLLLMTALMLSPNFYWVILLSEGMNACCVWSVHNILGGGGKSIDPYENNVLFLM